jgi:predicted phage-related endonuclease
MLTAEQLKARAGKLTGSRVAALMKGDVVAIDRLYREMIGEAEEENLRHVWPVRLGEATEQLNLDWFEQKNHMPVTSRGRVMVHPRHNWAACTLDGWSADLACPIECKNVGGREPLEVVIDRYQPQMQWLMEITGAKQCALSVIMGANEPIVEYIDRDDGYIAEMIRRGRMFMDCVMQRIPPVTLPEVPSPIIADKSYDLSTNNTWVSFAAEWIATRASAEKCKEAEKVLKSIMPPDAAKAFGAGVRITRDRAGRLSLREAAS